MSTLLRTLPALVLALALALPARAALSAADNALLDRDYAQAAALYQAEVDRGGAVDRALVGLGTALRLKGDHAGAIAAFERVTKEFGSSAVRARAAFRRAESLGATGKWSEAAEAWQKEAERLLSPTRKEEMAQGYLTLAEKAMAPADNTPAPAAGQATVPRDPSRAAHAYGKALEIGLSPAKARTVRLARAQAQLAAGQTADARTELSALEKEIPAGSAEAGTFALTLAEALNKAGDTARARRRYRELAAHKDAGAAAPRALLELARTYGLPNPTDAAALERGAEALRELSKRFPGDPLAIEGQLLLAQSLLSLGQHDEAQAHLKELAAVKDVPEPLLARARLTLARSLRTQKRHDEALAAYSAYLSAHPFHEESVNAQREVMDTQYEAAGELADHKKPLDAAKAFEAFLVRYPLDARGADVLLRLAKIEQDKEDPQQAVEAYRRVVSKYPNTEQAGRAQFEIGQIFETTMADPKSALVEYAKLSWGGEWASRAQSRKSTLESRELTIAPQRVLRTNEAAALTVRTRNLKNLTVKVYRVDPATYFARMNNLGGLEGLDIDLINPDHTFEHAVPEAKDFVLVESKIALPVKGPGLWVVQVGESEIWASIGVLVSDLELLVKSSNAYVFAVTWNGVTGQPQGDVELVMSDGSRTLATRRTGADGVLDLSNGAPVAAHLNVLALANGSAASTALSPGSASTSSLAPRGFIYTDRPAYRPGQLVHVKCVLREVKDSAYAFTPGEEMPVTVVYPSGRALFEQKLKLSEHGTIAFDVTLPAGTPDGDYQVRVGNPRRQQFAGSFRVSAYQMPSMVVRIEPAATVLAENEPFRGKIRVTRPDGSPVRDVTLNWKVDGQPEDHQVITDAKGEVAFDVDTRDLNDVSHTLRASVGSEGVGAATDFQIAGVGVKPAVRVDRDVVLAFEQVTAHVSVKDVMGKPVEAPVKLEAVRTVTGPNGQPAEVIDKTFEGKTDAAGDGTIAVTLTRGGAYTLRVWAADSKGHRASATAALTVTSPDDPVRVRILTESDTVRAGEAAALRVISWARDGQALLTVEAGHVLHHQILTLKTGENAVSIPMVEAYAPNVTLAVTLLDGGRLHTANRELTVRHGLALAVAPDAVTHAPGAEVELKVTATDHLGKPVDAEVSIAVVDEALLSLFPDNQGTIQNAFQQRRESTALSTASSAGTTYAASVRTLSEELLAEENKGRRVTLKFDAPVPAGQILRTIGSRGGFRVIVPPDLEVRPATVDLNDVAAEEALYSFAASQGYRADKMKVGGRNAFVLRAQANNRHGLAVGSVTPAGPAMVGLVSEEVEVDGIAEAAKEVVDDELGEANESDSKKGGRGNMLMAPSIQAANAPMRRSELKRQLRMAGRKQKARVQKVLTYSGQKDMRLVEKASADGDEDSPEGAPGEDGAEAPTVRDFFPETAFWVSSLRTGEGGTGAVKFKLPSSLTRYRILARAVTRTSQVGEATASVVAARELSSELLVPPYMVEGDEAGLFALVRGSFDKPTSVTVDLASQFGAGGPIHQTVEFMLAPGAEQRVPLKVVVREGDAATLTLTATAGKVSDAVRRVVPLRPRGAFHYDSSSGLLTEETGIQLKLPEVEITGRKLAITLSPGLPGALRDALASGDQIGGSSATDQARRELACFDATQVVPGVLGEREERRAKVAALLGQIAGQTADTVAVGAALRLELYGRARRSGIPVADVSFNEAAQITRNLYPAASDDDKLRILAAQALVNQADFSLVNRFLRGPHGLNARTAHLVITLARMGRKEKAIEVASALVNGQTADALEPSAPSVAGDEDPGESAALRLSALLAARPDAPGVQVELDRLLGLRGPYGWASARSAAAACEALTSYLVQHVPEAANFRLRVRVNDGEEQTLASTDLTVPKVLEFEGDKIPPTGPVRVNLKLEGRGSVDYRAVLSGFQPGRVEPRNSSLRVNRSWTRTPLVHKGKDVPRGSGAVAGSYTWPNNPLTQLSLGQSADVNVQVWTNDGSGRMREELMLEERIPPGCSVVDRSLTGNYRHVKVADGVITAYFSPAAGYSPSLNYRMVGRLPGRYSVLPARALSLHHPKRYGYSEGNEIRDGSPLGVLEPGQASTDAYRMTPDELLYLGKSMFEDGQHEQAWTYLTELRQFTLNDEASREVSRILLLLAIERGDNAAVLKNFETLKEKYRDLSLPFDVVMRVGKAHREMNEHEQASYVFRGIAEASFLLEAQLPGEWEQSGDLPRAADTTRSLIAEYPDLSVVQTSHLGLAQLAIERAGSTDAGLRHIGQELLEEFLVNNPDSPMDDEATFALAESALDSDHPEVARAWAEAGERRYPKSRLKDAFLHTQGWALFEKGDHAKALERLQPVARETFSDGQASESRPLALYLIAQIHHTQGRILEALAAYRQVADRFTDARETADELAAREVKCPEVTRVDPGQPAVLPVTVRNVSKVEARAYRVDLMRLYLRERSLSGITRVNLSGIAPLHEAVLEVKDAEPGVPRTLSLGLPFKDEGAYLVVLKGEDVSSSALVLISHLSLTVGEDAGTGRVRVHVQKQPEAKPVYGAFVRVVGSSSSGLSSGRTDPRGLYTAESVSGTSTVIARMDDSYAFYRGTQALASQRPTNVANAPEQALKAQVLSGLQKRARSLGQERSAYLQQRVYRNNVQGVEVQQMAQ